MSRIGKKPIAFPAGVEVNVDKGQIEIIGPKGRLSHTLPPVIDLKLDDHRIVVEKKVESRQARSLHGLTRSLIFNMVQGVTEGFQKQLVVSGLGYRVQMQGKNLNLAIGFSHPVIVSPPPGIEFEVGQRNVITVRGTDKQRVGQVAAEIRSLRRPEPYKGSGIAYSNEVIRRKVGKAGV
jgi:large subunit ribosomal protein L6